MTTPLAPARSKEPVVTLYVEPSHRLAPALDGVSSNSADRPSCSSAGGDLRRASFVDYFSVPAPVATVDTNQRGLKTHRRASSVRTMVLAALTFVVTVAVVTTTLLTLAR